MMSLEEELINGNSESVKGLEKIYIAYAPSASFFADLIKLITKSQIQTQVTWLLKKHLENEFEPTAQEGLDFWEKLPLLITYEAKLHALQCFPYLKINAVEKDSIEHFLRENLGSANKFVRAWAYNGFYLFAEVNPEYREEVENLLTDAMLRESASVKARIRNVAKKSFLSGKSFD